MMEGQEITDAFMRPDAYDEKIEGDIKLIQTHISWVFLTGKYAYKIKKPVDFGFLDFTALEKRRKYCDLELRLNSRLCPEIYLDVLPVTKEKDGKLKINGNGKIVEYALKMKQLPQDRLMNKLLDEGEIGDEIIDRIAKIVADFHSKAETSSEISEFGKPEKLKFNWDENFRQTEPFAGKVISRKDFEFVKREIENFIKDNEHLFEKRIIEKKTRRVHGDLHSGNIFIINGKPCIFDCIEFNLRFSCQDVAGDVAFLSMDLDYRNQKELSGFFIGKYIEYSGDNELAKVLDFYKCYYAWVRGKVTAFRLRESLGEREKKHLEETSKRYFRLALEYAKNI